MKLLFVSLGCDKNLVDSEEMLGALVSHGFEVTDDESQADVIVVNTCCFIHDAKEESIQAILEMADYKTKGNLKALIVTGCLAQRYKEEITKEIPEVDAVLGTNSQAALLDAVDEALKGKVSHVFAPLEGIPQMPGKRMITTGGFYEYLKIAEGCNKHCTYCIIPYARGPIRSLPLEEAVAQTRQLCDQGFREIVLTGIEISAYGADQTPRKTLCDLVEAACLAAGDARISLGSLKPTMIDEAFCSRLSKLGNLCRHFHLSVQSGCTETLKRMNRKYGAGDIRRAVSLLRSYFGDPNITADLIVGFPGETYEEFCETLRLIREMEFTSLFTFIFSPRPGTRAAEMEDPVTYKEKTQWFSELLKTQEEIAAKRCASMVGSTERVLIEERNEKNGLLSGRTASSIIVEFPGEDEWIGEFKNVKVTEARNWILRGECVD